MKSRIFLILFALAGFSAVSSAQTVSDTTKKSQRQTKVKINPKNAVEVKTDKKETADTTKTQQKITVNEEGVSGTKKNKNKRTPGKDEIYYNEEFIGTEEE